jgi:hypothetical protein
MVPDPFIRLMRGVVALGALVAFVWLSLDALKDVIDADSGVVPSYNDWALYWLTALAALVGGVTAVAFGQSPPPLPAPPEPNPNPDAVPGPPPSPEPASTLTFTSLSSANLSALARSVSFGKISVAIVGMLYILLYLGFGVAACFVWGANFDEVSQPVKNLALTFAGMALPIAQGFFSIPSRA